MKKVLCGILNVFCFIAENTAVIGGVGLVAIMGVTIVDVVLRRFGSTVTGSVELVSYLICVVVFLGFGKCTFLDSFTKVEVFDFRKAEFAVKVLMHVIHTVMCAIAGYYCIVQSAVIRRMGTASLMLSIPRWPFIFLSGIGFFLVAASVPLSIYINHMLKNAEINGASDVKEGHHES